MGETNFLCPLDCLPGAGEVWSGQYDFPARVQGKLRIVDIGANCGAFALWAVRRWPESEVLCYEPHPVIFRDYLKPNIRHDGRIVAYEAAVGDPMFGMLRPGLDTRLCSSQYDIGRQGNASMKVQVVTPAMVPPCELMKIDAEGAEGYIVEQLSMAHALPMMLVVEFHSDRLRQRVEEAVRGEMELVGMELLGRGWGHAKYVKPEVVR
jgi:FkbM family methyltransferase